MPVPSPRPVSPRSPLLSGASPLSTTAFSPSSGGLAHRLSAAGGAGGGGGRRSSAEFLDPRAAAAAAAAVASAAGVASASSSPSQQQKSAPPPPPAHVNRNAEWVSTPGGWAFVLCLVLLGWLAASAALGDPGAAWTVVHLAHGLLSFYLFHWMKGSPVASDQGKYDALTFWEQLDDGVQNTATRKFLIALPAVTFALASHGSDYSAQPLGLNLVVLLVLLVAKLPAMHTVRLFGINRW